MGIRGFTGFGGGATGLMNAGGSAPVEASGGIVSEHTDPEGTWKAHTFVNPGTFVVTAGGDVEWLVVGGGGGGGSYEPGVDYGSGGGGGGFRSSAPEGPGGPSPTQESALTVSEATYPITVGAGGRGLSTYGYYGEPSIITAPDGTPIIAQGGGGGNGSGQTAPAADMGGGCGGGGGSGNVEAGTTTPAPTQGYPGLHPSSPT